MTWGQIEHPHELRYTCDHAGCEFEVTASAHDPLVLEVVDQHEAAHDLPGLSAKWAHSHVAQPSVWDPAREPTAAIVAVGVLGLIVLALLGVAVVIVAGWVS